MPAVVAAVVIFGVCVFVSLLIAVPLQTAGYDAHVSKNGDLVETTCNVTGHYVAETTCYRRCRCITVCEQRCTTYRNANGHVRTSCSPYCSERCQSCPYTCYGGVWTVQYVPVGSDMALMGSRDQGQRFDHRSGAQAALSAFPDGSSMICFYEQEDAHHLRFERYNVTGFYVSFIFFYVLAGLSFVGLIISAAVWFVRQRDDQ